MKIRRVMLVVVLITLLTAGMAYAAVSGGLEPADGPTDELSQMVTLEQIYDRLDTGAEETKMTTFTEPLAGPGGTMHTLDDIMGAAPAVDDTNGLTAADVASGKKFWGLTSGEWGLQTGTAAACDPSTTACAAGPGFDYPLIPKTGQTTSYATGDDGETQYGIDPALAPTVGTNGAYNTPAWAGVRFTDKGDGTITDNVTGLIWLKNANCFDFRAWSQALPDANGLASGSCGLNDGSSAGDWRLPNVNELHSLIDLTQASAPKLPTGHPFTGVQSSSYWSSTSNADGPSLAWVVDLDDGGVYRYYKTDHRPYVWPVHGGQ